jgi:hypothetical protein
MFWADKKDIQNGEQIFHSDESDLLLLTLSKDDNSTNFWTIVPIFVLQIWKKYSTWLMFVNKLINKKIWYQFNRIKFFSKILTFTCENYNQKSKWYWNYMDCVPFMFWSRGIYSDGMRGWVMVSHYRRQPLVNLLRVVTIKATNESWDAIIVWRFLFEEVCEMEWQIAYGISL